MKAKTYISFLVLMICFTSSCQTVKKASFASLEKKLTTFLIDNGDIHNLEVEDYKSGKRSLTIIGLYNNYNKGELLNGIYSFSQNRTHARAYFLIIDNEKYTILNLSSRKGLDEAIKNTLNFCEKNKYCVDISNDYVSRLIRVYYTINKNPNARIDINCESGVISTKDLP